MKVRGGSEQIDFDKILFSADLEIFQSPSLERRLFLLVWMSERVFGCKKNKFNEIEVGNSPCKKVVFDEKSLHLLKTFLRGA